MVLPIQLNVTLSEINIINIDIFHSWFILGGASFHRTPLACICFEALHKHIKPFFIYIGKNQHTSFGIQSFNLQHEDKNCGKAFLGQPPLSQINALSLDTKALLDP